MPGSRNVNRERVAVDPCQSVCFLIHPRCGDRLQLS
jgi:hypothetical protein